MKLLLATYEYPPDRGGVAGYLGGLFRELPETRVLKLKQPRLPFAWLLQLPRLAAAARAADLVVVSHLLPLGTAAMLSRKPYAVIVHGLDLRLARRKKNLASRVLKKAKLIIANSRATASELSFFGIDPKSALVLTPAIDPEWQPLSEVSAAQPAWKTVLAVGRFVQRKGFDRLIRLLPALRQRCGEVRLVLAGSGPEEGRLRDAASTNGVGPEVAFVVAPDRGALSALYAACNAFALPVRASQDDVEGFGVVFLEAAAFGKPVVATRSGGIPEAVEDGVTGLLADPASDEEFLEKLASVLNDSQMAERLGRAGRERVLRDFQWKERAMKLRARLA